MPAAVSRRSAHMRPFLKWAGGKYQILDRILAALPAGRRLVEPFAGSGVVFLNAPHSRFLINDINPHLIGLYRHLQDGGETFIDRTRSLFKDATNTAEAFYRMRRRFNTTGDEAERSALLVYLNRHGYNGLIRYNASGEFNVPFGRYRRPYFPEQEMRHFHQRSRLAEFTCLDFRRLLGRIRRGNVVYADPPYVPLSATSSFTAYSSNGFGTADQDDLARAAAALSGRGVPVLLSNHDTAATRRAYRGARLSRFTVRRTISCKGGQRERVGELLAFFAPAE